jgi:catechol 2,3-dioxygenase-like lactoylglutathione lyase family enzyme
MPMLLRIGHINIRTPELERTLSFYERLLDLRRGPAATMADQQRNAWLFDGEGRAVIHVNMPAPGEPLSAPAGPLDHVAFDCSDLDGMRGRLDAMAVPYSERKARVAGLTQISLRDPNGLKLELAFGSDHARRDRLPA